MTTDFVARSQPVRLRIEPIAVVWLLLLVFSLICLLLGGVLPWVILYPKDWGLPMAQWINTASDPVFAILRPLCRDIAVLLDWPLRGIRDVLQWLPWPATMLITVGLALRAGGLRLAVFAAAALTYMVLTGYWRQSMNTLAVVAIAVPLSVLTGFAIGVLADRVPRLRQSVEALLDLMQTVPAFAYLIPLLLLFGFGPSAGLVASAIYAVPPMVRNTMLGLRMVPQNVRESGIMGGCTPRQNFWEVEVPTALPQLLVGINQTTMAALSMVIIDAIIGGFDDIGWVVLSSMRKAELGQSLLSGAVIALMAIVIDRITLGFASTATVNARSGVKLMRGKTLFLIIGAALVLAVLLRATLPEGNDLLPEGQGRDFANDLNATLLAFVAQHAAIFEWVRNAVLYCLMLPLRIGISGSATPAIWGFELTPALLILYAAVVFGVSILAWRASWKLGVSLLYTGLLLYSGFAGFPWPALITAVSVLAYVCGGRRLMLFATGALLFMLVNGLWLPLMQSAYLCALAVVICLAVGGALGVWAAHNERVSKILRPINDALQTMPQFVFLIPALMFFKVGEFTALIAIMLYAIVPPIRYVEHGIRTVRPDIIEAAQQMGATPWQMLWQVKIPLAMPVIMLGLNQTIMAAISMLVIAAMVGTRDLGQQVYVALGKADAGLGLVAGLSIAMVAMVSDRILRRQVAIKPT
jgi:glycine betaine/proline transport system permease protein